MHDKVYIEGLFVRAEPFAAPSLIGTEIQPGSEHLKLTSDDVRTTLEL
jgi:hypothetical protein